MKRKEDIVVPLWEKYALTITESAQYFNIGEKKLRSVVNDNMDADFIFTIGSRVMIKRHLFEKFLDCVSSL